MILGTDRLLRPRGGEGFSPPPSPPKKNLHMKILSPLAITIFNIGTLNVHELFWMLQCNFDASV